MNPQTNLHPRGLSAAAVAGEEAVSPRFRALLQPPAARSTWAILDWDGAGRKVEPYLSSLALGEAATGAIASPAFRLGADAVEFTICGHDGQGGGMEKNWIALVDARTGEVLRRTAAPGNDALETRRWDVAELRGRDVRIEVRDGLALGAFAWLGVGRIDAGPGLRHDFRFGLPAGWKVEATPSDLRAQVVRGGVPFLALPHSLVPAEGAAEIPCGCEAKRIYLLGCTVWFGRPTEIHGHVTIQYREGPPERFPLLVGYTLEVEGKLLSRSRAMHLHPSGDPFQHYLAIEPRRARIEKIVVEKAPGAPAPPEITAITVETDAEAPDLRPLPDLRPDTEEEDWIAARAISAARPRLDEILEELRRAHKLDAR
ncbi:MAG: hypothetical protein ACUVYA_02455 [Planctomycetota bacterium]